MWAEFYINDTVPAVGESRSCQPTRRIVRSFATSADYRGGEESSRRFFSFFSSNKNFLILADPSSDERDELL